MNTDTSSVNFFWVPLEKAKFNNLIEPSKSFITCDKKDARFEVSIQEK